MRKAGTLIHISSLPNKYGIGSFGKSAYEFVDFLCKSNQSIWQILPLGPTSFGDSPYQTFSSFAINPYFIDLDQLINEGLLLEEDIKSELTNNELIDYSFLFKNRLAVLYLAFKNFIPNKNFHYFLEKNKFWTEDYSLFMALKEKFEYKPFNLWDKEFKFRDEKIIKNEKEKLNDRIDFHLFLQFKAYEQWYKLKSYANENGVEIIGDMPIYVAYDSTDVWMHNNFFQLNSNLDMINVAGVPPDGFSEEGQLWGNPLYNWDALKKENYSYMIKRIQHNLEIYDYLRIDHFVGFEHYYSIPFGKLNAKVGEWIKGPSKDFFHVLRKKISTLKIIAEDLGRKSQGVLDLLEFTNFPGMNITQHLIGTYDHNTELIFDFKENSVSYTGTHDNETTLQWYENLSNKDKVNIRKYLGVIKKKEICNALIHETLKSKSKIVVIPIQDYLEQNSRSRMNEPGTTGNNWRYRTFSYNFSSELAERIKKLIFSTMRES